MRRSVLRYLGASAVLIATVQGARAQLADGIADHIKRGVPVVGADVGVTIPVSKAQKVQDPGGAIAPYAGFEIPLGLDIAFTPIIQPQYAAFGCEGCTVYSITSLTAGARFSF